MKAAAAICSIAFALLAGVCQGQEKRYSDNQVDDRVRNIPVTGLQALADALTAGFNTDREKSRAIFTWISEHISYRVKRKYGVAVPGARNVAFVDTSTLFTSNDVVAEAVLRNGSAYCDGYARLFKALCDHAGLRAAVITGFANGDFIRRPVLRCNHTWNAIYLDSSWQLLDVTWASGYTNYSGDEFIKRFDDTYFLSRPERFIADHFPDDIRWTLMDEPDVPSLFKSMPYRNRSFSKYRINAWYPQNGIIEAQPGDTVRITLESTDPLADARMCADTATVFDSAMQRYLGRAVFLEPDTTAGTHKNFFQYRFVVADQQVEWLHLLYNHDAIIRYRLKILYPSGANHRS